MLDPAAVRSRSFLRGISALDWMAIILLVACLVSVVVERWGFHLSFFSARVLLLLLSLGYIVLRLLPWVRQKVLWSLRNRLIVTYVFIAAVPTLLLLGLFAFSTYLLYMELGAHLLYDHLHRERTAVAVVARDAARLLSQEAARDGGATVDQLLKQPEMARFLASVEEEYPEMALHVEPAARRHSMQQDSNGAPEADFVQEGKRLWFAATVPCRIKQGRVFVTVWMPVTAEMLDRMSPTLGPVALVVVRPAAPSDAPKDLLRIENRDFVTAEKIASKNRNIVPRLYLLDWAVSGVTTLEAVDATSQEEAPAMVPVLAYFSARSSEIGRVLFQSLGSLGWVFVIALAVIGGLFLILGIGGLVTGFVLARRITHAVGELYRATTHIRQGDFNHRIQVEQDDQLGALGQSFNEMTASLAQHVEEQRQAQRLENELSIAREVQEQLFPRSLPSVPGVDLAALCRAARVVSGDYYDFIRIGPAQMAMAVADISGKGISAALLMASLQAALRSQALLDGHPGVAEMVSRLNRHLYLNTSDDRYATLFYATYDAETRQLIYTNAGHLPPLLVTEGDVMPLDAGGTVVGLFEDCEYEERRIPITPGSVLVAFSDGLTEPENAYGEQFGVRRLAGEILRHRHSGTERLAERLIEASEEWGNVPEQADDMTVIVARFR